MRYIKYEASIYILQNCAVNLHTCMLITIPRSRASQKGSFDVERS